MTRFAPGRARTKQLTLAFFAFSLLVYAPAARPAASTAAKPAGKTVGNAAGGKRPRGKDERLSFNEKASLVYDRLAFGPRPGDVERLKKGGPAQLKAWIEAQLHPETIDDSQLELKLAQYEVLHLSPAELYKIFLEPRVVAEKQGIPKDKFASDEELKKKIREQIGEDHLPEQLVQQMIAAKLIRAVESNRQLQEVLADFWFNHFNVDITKGENRYLVPGYDRDVIRAHMFGKFGDLLKATAHSPAMLVYLDNRLSESPLDYNHPGKEPKPRKKGLNENYARELLELHTLGVDGGYSQEDVTQLARILTGWSADDLGTDPHFVYKDKVHDKGDKVFLEQSFPAGHGEDEGLRALDLLAQHPATAKFITLKLLHLFVSDNPPASLIEKVRRRFVLSGGDLTAVYREIFMSDEFWSHATEHSKVKKPLFLVASAIRALEGEVLPSRSLTKTLGNLGEDLFKCVPPTGYVDRADNWVNPGALVSRLNFALELTANRVEGVYVLLPRLERKILTMTDLVRALAEVLVHEPLSVKTEQVILQELGHQSFKMANGEVRPWVAAKATGLILGSPEFQRR